MTVMRVTSLRQSGQAWAGVGFREQGRICAIEEYLRIIVMRDGLYVSEEIVLGWWHGTCTYDR